MSKIKDLIKEMTLEEKASLCSGESFWFTQGIERLDIPSVMLSDGPHGLRKQADAGDHLGINKSIEAVCFPTAPGMAASFDRDLAKRVGEVLGDECQAENLSIILGPGVNIKRSPLCGRNFEYYSEDPYLTGQIAANQINGVQSKNIGTSMKHYLANNQEYRRMTSNSVIDERTLREIYLTAFEISVKEAKPWTLMCSYNKINGVYGSENKYFLNDILRDEWGFEGFVMTDWGATNDRVLGLKAGLELEMPSSNGANDKKIVEAVKDGSLEESILDRAVERFLNKVYQYLDNKDESAVFDRDKDHEIAREIAGDTMVLLKNEGNILPLDKDKKIAFIGKFAKEPRYQGNGSSFINASKISSPFDEVGEYAEVTYAQGYDTDKDEIDKELFKEAIKTAEDAELVVFFGGLPGPFESEGFDRAHLNMPNVQNELIKEISKVQKNIVVVLYNGSPVLMPWLDNVEGVLEGYLGGQAVGGATIDVLFGKVNPNGKLAETFPCKLSDNPSYLNFPGEKDVVEYKEGIFVGYRYYDIKEMDVLFPFGFGLSYTDFEYSNLKLSTTDMKDTEVLTVSVDVTNTGNVFGKEVVQLYVGANTPHVIRPLKELREFAKVSLEPNETKTVTFELSKRAFAYYNVSLKDWHVVTADYEIMIGKSSRDIVLTDKVNIKSTVIMEEQFTLNSTVGDLYESEVARPFVEQVMAQFGQLLGGDKSGDIAEESLGEGTADMMKAMASSMPLRAIMSFAGEHVTEEQVLGFLDQINNASKNV